MRERLAASRCMVADVHVMKGPSSMSTRWCACFRCFRAIKACPARSPFHLFCSTHHRVAHLAFDADNPLPPPPLPRQPKPNQVGPWRVFSTWAEYEAALAEYTRQRDDPARIEAARLYKRAQDRRYQQRKRRERPEPTADATRARQARRVAERAALMKGRGA